MSAIDGQPQGIHTSFYDMEVSPSFGHSWLLLRSMNESCLHTPIIDSNNIISIYFRMDEVLDNIQEKKSTHSDSHLTGLEELEVWLDAVPAATNKGPVVLVGTYGDVVSTKEDQQVISNYIIDRLRSKEHPLLEKRLVKPDNGLVFYAVDNTRSDHDPGIIAYRNKIQYLRQARISRYRLVCYSFKIRFLHFVALR